MTRPVPIPPPDDTTDASPSLRGAAFAAVSAAFGSLGRVCLALDAGLRIRYASGRLDALLGEGASRAVVGRHVAELLGDALFGPGGSLREALEHGQRREGWRASVPTATGSACVSVTAAPLVHDVTGVCDPEASYLLVLRPAEDDAAVASGAPTGFGGMIGRSPLMAQIFRFIQNLSHSDAAVLLTGESGTGKEMVARAVHAMSPRRDGPFVAVNCGALPAELLESELFGHVRGAFTGAVRDRVGRFAAAAGGTLFLDEVGDLPLPLQVKLLRVLQDRSYERVGESQTRRSDARIIAATNVNLPAAVRAGAFREDLYYRLRVVPIELPPLRARREDIEPIARHLLTRVCDRTGRALRFSPDALRVLLRHDWPGNVRELENAIEFAVAVCRGQTILPEDLPLGAPLSSPLPPSPAAPLAAPAPVVSVPLRADGEEARALRAALESHHWRRDEAAHALGISRTTLWRKMREHRLLDETD